MTLPVPVIVQQGKILDFIDGLTQRKDTPEEYVRQEIAKSLVREYDYARTEISVQFGAEPVELMFSALFALAQAKETVGELLPIVREYGSDANGASPLPMSRRKRRALAAVLLL